MAGKKKSGKLREANALSLGDKTTRRGKEPAVGPAVTDEGSSSERKSAPRAARRTKPVAKMLYEFWGRAERRVGEQYEGARERHAEDAGTRGDQGEEDWASVLREWLPPRFRVVTKGRLAGSPGIRHATGLSGQLDLFVLHPDYPAALEREKLYLMEGVVAAFECKARVTTRHVAEAVATGYQLAAIEELPFAPTPYRYMNRRVFFGLLGHTHSWRGTTERKLPSRTRTRES